MKGRDGFVQAYNAGPAVDATAQVIVAHHLTNKASDQDACLVSEHCWDPVGLATVEYAHRFQRLVIVSRQG